MLGTNVSYRRIGLLLTLLGLGIIAAVMPLLGASRAFSGEAGYKIRANSELSASCGGQNAEVHQAVDPELGYVYEAWTGCGGIGFARSTDGGRGYSRAISLPGSAQAGADDPAVAVAPDGTVYASFMVHGPELSYPVVAASFDHGATFAQVASLTPLAPRIGAMPTSLPSGRRVRSTSPGIMVPTAHRSGTCAPNQGVARSPTGTLTL
jgi:hypothetical protein